MEISTAADQSESPRLEFGYLCVLPPQQWKADPSTHPSAPSFVREEDCAFGIFSRTPWGHLAQRHRTILMTWEEQAQRSYTAQ